MYSDCVQLQSSGEILALKNNEIGKLQLLVTSSISSTSTTSTTSTIPSSSYPPSIFDLEFDSIDNENNNIKSSLPPCPKEEKAILKVSQQSERILVVCDGIAVSFNLPMLTQTRRSNSGKIDCTLVWKSNEYIADACWSPHNDDFVIILQRDAIYIINVPSSFCDEKIFSKSCKLYEKISLKRMITEPRAISFFPRNSSNWNSMTASILYEDGSIYLICPLLVPGALIPIADYNQMLAIENENEVNIIPSARSVPFGKVNGSQLRQRWLRDLFKVSTSSSEMKFTPLSNHEIFGKEIDTLASSSSSSSSSQWSVCLQGPLLSIPEISTSISTINSEIISNSKWSDIIARSAAVVLPMKSSVSNFVILSVVRQSEVKTIMSVAPISPSWTRRRTFDYDSIVHIATPGVVMPQEDAKEQCLDHSRMLSLEGNPDWVLVDAISLPILPSVHFPYFIRDENLDALSDLFYIATENRIFEVSQFWRRALVDPVSKEIDSNFRSSCSRIIWERRNDSSNTFSVCISCDSLGCVSVHEVTKHGVFEALNSQLLHKRIITSDLSTKIIDEGSTFIAPSVKSILVPQFNTLMTKVDYLEKLESMISCIRDLRNKQLELHNRSDSIKIEGNEYKMAYDTVIKSLLSLKMKQETLYQKLENTLDVHKSLLNRIHCITRLLKCSISTDGGQIEADLLSLRTTVLQTKGVLLVSELKDNTKLSVSRNDIDIARQYSSVVGSNTIASKAEIELAQNLNRIQTTLESSSRNRLQNMQRVIDIETTMSKLPTFTRQNEQDKQDKQLEPHEKQLYRDRLPRSPGSSMPRVQKSTDSSIPRARSRSASRKGRLSLSSRSASQMRDDFSLSVTRLGGVDPLTDALEIKRTVAILSEELHKIGESV
jgi:hypothetical protein